MISTILFSGIPTIFYKGKEILTIHSIPYLENGYFYELPQRLVKNKKEILSKVRFLLLTTKRETEIDALKTLSENHGKAFEERNYKNDQYRYAILQLAETNFIQYSVVKKFLRGLLRQIIIKSCINKSIDPKVGICFQDEKLGIVKDISFSIDAEIDLIAVKFFKIKQQSFWESTNWLSDAGIKMLVILFEKRKEQIKHKINETIDKIINIIY